jgi:hypothetical protein
MMMPDAPPPLFATLQLRRQQRRGCAAAITDIYYFRHSIDTIISHCLLKAIDDYDD